MAGPILPSSSKALQRANPLNLMIVLLVLIVPGVFFIGKFNTEPGIEWSCVMIGVLFYCWISAILSFFTYSYWRFFKSAILCFVLLVLVSFFLASYVSGTPFYEIYTYNQFFKALIIFYFMGLFVALVLRNIVAFLEAN